jgi:type I restriction enzyme S subunit
MPPPKSDEGIPFITISNINEYHNIDFENTMYVPESYYNSLAEKRKPCKGDILYTVVGSYGMPVCIEDEKKFVFQRHIAILRPNNDIVKSRYMFHAMQSTDFKIQADKSAKDYNTDEI